MTKLLEYRGYFGSADYSPEDEVFHGKLEFIRDLVTFEANEAKGLKRAFEEAVDDYLALCDDTGRQPEKPLKGTFNVRPGRDLHRRAMLLARRKGSNLNSIVTEALRSYLDRDERSGARDV
jgi:predicted HicB family RNase H-like nuclease